MTDGDGRTGSSPVDLCDVCGRLLTEEDDELIDLLPDSSFIHPRDPRLDGRRLVVTCSGAHLAEVQREYRRRPFVEAELWAGKLNRVLGQHRGQLSRLTLEELTEAAGLTPQQLQVAMVWMNAWRAAPPEE